MKIDFNTTIQQVHEWGGPEQNPLKRMFLTRIGSLACAILELVPVGRAILELCKRPSQKTLVDLCKAIAGLASTIFIGIVFSPEVNFFIHVKLQLVEDDFESRKLERERQASVQRQNQERRDTERDLAIQALIET